MRVHPLVTGFGLSFLLEGEHGLVLIDTGSPGQEKVVLRALDQLNRHDLKLIWITHAHYDHFGSAAALQAATGARLGVHPADAPFLMAGQSPLGRPRGRGWVLRVAQRVLQRVRPLAPVQPDCLLDDGARLDAFGLDATVLHTPGHTPGHTCLLLDDGTAFAADLIGRRPYPRLQSWLATGWDQLLASLAKLQAAHPTVIYTGHALKPMTGEELQRITS
jgi:glyoxylase-like metal-dependent hydrolase (beta-lactamase superfamily II)